MSNVKPGQMLYGVWYTYGMYSDRNDWLLAVYPTREAAELHIAEGQKELARVEEELREADAEFDYDSRSSDLREAAIRNLKFLWLAPGVYTPPLSGQFYISWVMVHQDPMHHREECQISVDKAVEEGKLVLTSDGPPSFLELPKR